MLDTRIVGREKQLSYASYFTSSGLNVPAFVADWQNPSRTILGSEQRSWLLSALANSSAQWQVLGNQVLMGKMYIPAELLPITAQLASSPTPALFAQYTALVTELVTIKTRLLAGDPTLPASEKARVANVLPYNLDAWDGYPAEREAIFSAAAGKKLISLAGDTHNAWHSTLSNSIGNKTGIEFATPSVSSPGLEAIFGNDPQTIGAFESANKILIDDLLYVNASKRGFLLISFTANSAQADYHYIRTIATKDITSTVEYTATET
jgi:alkaline phosphatase D